MNDPARRLVIKDTSRRDLLIGILAGALILGLILFAVDSLSRHATGNWRTGKIVSKSFTPRKETDITIGRNGVSSEQIDGDYTLDVDVPSDAHTYHVWVGKDDYLSHSVGDSFHFLLTGTQSQ